MSEDLTKLPKWAQYRIRTAERRFADVVAERDALLATLPPTDTAVIDHYMDENAIPHRREQWLPTGATVVFRLDPADRHTEIQVSVLARNGRRVVEVMGSRAIAVMPSASNVVHVAESP